MERNSQALLQCQQSCGEVMYLCEGYEVDSMKGCHTHVGRLNQPPKCGSRTAVDTSVARHAHLGTEVNCPSTEGASHEGGHAGLGTRVF